MSYNTLKYTLLDYFLHGKSINDNPGSTSEIIYQSVRVNLEYILNTYLTWRLWDNKYIELSQSIIAFGIEDINKYDLSSTNMRHIFCEHLAHTVKVFEPRLKNISIDFIPTKDFVSFAKLRIQAALSFEEGLEVVVYNSIMDTISGSILVSKELQ